MLHHYNCYIITLGLCTTLQINLILTQKQIRLEHKQLSPDGANDSATT